jgi:Rrf2 family transcriptional regulator, iron-sulfur cluster assembly transcription factor
MYFSQTAEYALRAMIYLAALGEGESISGRDLSAHTDIPPHYLSKIMRRLVVEGLVDSQRGHNGGFQLARPAAEIRFLDVLLAADYVPSGNRCAFGWGKCDAAYPCPLHEAWGNMSEQFARWARDNTLASVSWPLERLDALVARRSPGARKAREDSEETG